MDVSFNILDPTFYAKLTEEPMYEMSTVAINKDKPNLLVMVNVDPNRIGNPYFKVFNSSSYQKATKVARLHFFDEGVELHRGKYEIWDLTKKDIKIIKEFLQRNHKGSLKYTNWQMACWLWNLEYNYFQFDIDDIDRYMNGDFDKQFKDHPSYIPSDTPIPETWILNKK